MTDKPKTTGDFRKANDADQTALQHALTLNTPPVTLNKRGFSQQATEMMEPSTVHLGQQEKSREALEIQIKVGIRHGYRIDWVLSRMGVYEKLLIALAISQVGIAVGFLCVVIATVVWFAIRTGVR